MLYVAIAKYQWLTNSRTSYVSVFLTSLFLWPLVKTGRVDPLLRRVAKRTLL
jgi:hypothetical protein